MLWSLFMINIKLLLKTTEIMYENNHNKYILTVTLYNTHPLPPSFCSHRFIFGPTFLYIGDFSPKIVLPRVTKKSNFDWGPDLAIGGSQNLKLM